MGWLERLLRLDGSATHHVGDVPGDGGMAFRSSLLQDAQERERRRRLDEAPLRVNSTWRWTGDRWQQWSTLWQDYSDVGEADVPSTLLDELSTAGVVPVAGDRFRWDDGDWVALDPGAPDVLPTDDGMA